MKKLAIGAAAAAFLVARPAAAQIITGADPAAIAAVIQAEGVKATVAADKEGDPMIKGDWDGTKFDVYFYGCQAHKNCKNLQFTTGFLAEKSKPATLQSLNEWNRTHRFGRAYLDTDGEPMIEMDVDMEGGGLPKATLKDNVQTWLAVVGMFSEYLYGKR